MPKQPNQPNRRQKMRTAQAINLAQVGKSLSTRIGIAANGHIDHGHTADRKSENAQANDHAVQVVAVTMTTIIIIVRTNRRVSIVAVIDRRPMIAPADPVIAVTSATNTHGRRVVEAIAIDGPDRMTSTHRVVDIRISDVFLLLLLTVFLLHKKLVSLNL